MSEESGDLTDPRGTDSVSEGLPEGELSGSDSSRLHRWLGKVEENAARAAAADAKPSATPSDEEPGYEEPEAPEAVSPGEPATELPSPVDEPAPADESAIVDEPAPVDESATVEEPAALVEEPAALVDEPVAEKPASKRTTAKRSGNKKPPATESPAVEPPTAEFPPVEPPAAEFPPVAELEPSEPPAAEVPPAVEVPAPEEPNAGVLEVAEEPTAEVPAGPDPATSERVFEQPATVVVPASEWVPPSETQPAAEGPSAEEPAIKKPSIRKPDLEGTGAVRRRPSSLRAATEVPVARDPEVAAVTPPPLEAVPAPVETPAPPAVSEELTGSPLDPVLERLATAQERAAVLARERPEVVIGAAFGGGLILAAILKRLGRR